MPDPDRSLSPNDVARAHAELLETGQVFLEDRDQASELAGRLPREGRPYFVSGRKLHLGESSRDGQDPRQARLDRIGPAPDRS
jgi:hypothetical protein